MNASPPWVTHSSAPVHVTRWLDVRRDCVTGPDGRVGDYDHIVLRPSVTVLAVDDAMGVAVTRQWIYTHGGTQWRLPAGGVDDADASPLAAAQRELAEEVGYTAERWTPLGRVHGADSATNHVDHLFLAEGLTPGEARLEATEADLQVHWLHLGTVLALVERGDMPHAGSTAAVLFGFRHYTTPGGRP